MIFAAPPSLSPLPHQAPPHPRPKLFSWLFCSAKFRLKHCAEALEVCSVHDTLASDMCQHLDRLLRVHRRVLHVECLRHAVADVAGTARKEVGRGRKERGLVEENRLTSG